MKKYQYFLLLLFAFSGVSESSSQVIFNDSDVLLIESGAVLYTEGKVVNTQSGVLITEGSLSADGSLENESSSTLKGNGNYFIGEDWINTASFLAQSSTATFTGSLHSDVTSSGAAFNHLRIEKSANGQIHLSDALSMTGNFHFLNNANYVLLNGFSFTLGSAASITGADGDNFFITNGTGKLRKEAMAVFTFPTGFSSGTYNPLSITQSGTVDRIDVRCTERVLENGDSGSPLSDVVDVSWEISEGTPGGSSLDLTAQWADSDELGSFDRSDCGIARYTGSCWDLTRTLQSPASGSDPYTIGRSGVSSTGYFAVGGDPLLKPLRVSPIALLEGPYNSSGEMDDLLRQAGHIPTTEPFTALGYTHKESGGGETVAASVLTVTGSDAIVDWVFVEIRTTTSNSSTVATRSALMQKDGDIVDTDGVSALNFSGIADGSYYVLIRSRNHIGVMSSGTLSLSKTTVSLDLKTTTANATGGTLALHDLGDGFFAFFSGDYNANGQIQNTDAAGLILDIGLSGYKAGDLDLNGQVQNAELQNILIPNIGKGAQFTY